MSSLAPSTSTVGGGSNQQTSNMYNQFLQQSLGGKGGDTSNASFGQWMQQNHKDFKLGPGSQDALTGFHDQFLREQSAGPQNGENQQGGIFQQLVNQQRNLTPQGIIDSNPYLRQAGNQLNAPGYVAPNLQNYNTQAPTNDIFSQLFGPGSQFSIPNVDASQFGANGQFAQQMLGQGVAQADNVGSVIGANGIGGLLNPDTNSPLFQALKAQQAIQDKTALAANHARFGAGGGQVLGSGAQYADATYQANANPANLLALNQIGTQQQQLDLTNRQASADALLNQRGQDITSRGQDVQANIASANLHQQGMQAAMQAYLSALQGNQQSAIQRLGIGESAARDQASNAVSQFNAGNNAIGLGNRDRLDESGQHNNFNRDIFGQQSTNQTNLGQLGLGITNTQQNALNNLLAQFFAAYNQSNGIGSPQAQTVQNPSDLGQLSTALGQLSSFYHPSPGGSAPAKV